MLEDDAILRDIAKAMRSASETLLKHAAEILIASFDKPVLTWTIDDKVFPFARAQRSAAAPPNARIEGIDIPSA